MGGRFFIGLQIHVYTSIVLLLEENHFHSPDYINTKDKQANPQEANLNNIREGGRPQNYQCGSLRFMYKPTYQTEHNWSK